MSVFLKKYNEKSLTLLIIKNKSIVWYSESLDWI